jgi:hypothetical protein
MLMKTRDCNLEGIAQEDMLMKLETYDSEGSDLEDILTEECSNKLVVKNVV